MFEIEGDEDMKKYDPDATCIKCGYGGIEDEHRNTESQAFCDMANSLARAANCLAVSRDPIPEHIARTCKNCGYSWREKPLDKPLFTAEYKRCWSTKEEIQEWVDSMADFLAPALGIPADMLKSWVSDDPTHAIVDEPGSTSEAIKEAMAKQVGRMEKLDSPVFEVGDILTVGEGDKCEHEVLAHPTEDWWCVSGYDRLFNKSDLHEHFTLIRKGSKVITRKGIRGTDIAIYVSGVQVDVLPIDGDKVYTITATEEE